MTAGEIVSAQTLLAGAEKILDDMIFGAGYLPRQIRAQRGEVDRLRGALSETKQRCDDMAKTTAATKPRRRDGSVRHPPPKRAAARRTPGRALAKRPTGITVGRYTLRSDDKDYRSKRDKVIGVLFREAERKNVESIAKRLKISPAIVRKVRGGMSA